MILKTKAERNYQLAAVYSRSSAIPVARLLKNSKKKPNVAGIVTSGYKIKSKF